MIIAIILAIIGGALLWLSGQHAVFSRHDSWKAIGYQIKDGTSGDEVHHYVWTLVIGWAALSAAAMRLYDLYGPSIFD